MTAAKESDRVDAIKAIKLNIDSINKQSLATGVGHGVLFPENDSLECAKDMGETIALLYTIPYKANVPMDYVGYAYGTVAFEQRGKQSFDVYKPDVYMNQCNEAVLDNGSTEDAKNIWKLMNDSIMAFSHLKRLESGAARGDKDEAKAMITVRVNYVDRCVSRLGVTPQRMIGNESSEIITACAVSNSKFAKQSAVEDLRCDGIFRDTNAVNNMIEL